MFRLLCVCALGVVPLVGCSDSGNGNDNWAPLDYEANPASAKYDFSAADSAVAVFMSDYPAVKGVTLAVVRGRDGQIYEKGYGDFSRDRISLIASTGKVLSVGVILSLVDDGVLELDRPIAEYLDWGDHHLTVTMRQILSMMSGLPEAVIPHVSPSGAAVRRLPAFKNAVASSSRTKAGGSSLISSSAIPTGSSPGR